MLLSGDRNLDLSGDGLRHVALKSKHVAQLAIIGFGPEVLVGRGANQLRVNANPVALPYYRPSTTASTPQRPRDFRHRELRVLEVHHRCAGNHAQIMNPGEAPDERLGHAVSKIFLRRIAREIFQRQYGQGV